MYAESGVFCGYGEARMCHLSRCKADEAQRRRFRDFFSKYQHIGIYSMRLKPEQI